MPANICLARRRMRRILGLDLTLVLGIQERIAGRYSVVRRALEDEEVLRLLGDERDRLNCRRAGADDADALAGEVDLLMRPATGVIDRAAKRMRDRGIAVYWSKTGSPSP